MNPVETAPSPPSILIVDDDPDIGQVLADLLEHEGYQAQVARTGTEAISEGREHRFSAVLLDLGLPDIDGLSVLQALLEIDPKLPVIVLTAYKNDEKMIASLGKGAFAYITKPFNPAELKATLHRAVGVKVLAVKAERAESALSESEERFRAVAQSANDAIILADENGNIIFWNNAAAQLFGYAEEEMLNQPLTLIMPPRYRDAHLKGLARLSSSGKGRVIGTTIEAHGLRNDGREFPLELSLSVGKTKTSMFFSAIIRDITYRKHAEEAQREQLGLANFSAEVGAALTRSCSLRDMLQHCTEIMVRHLDAAFARIWMLNSRENILELQASAGMYTHLDGPHSRVPVGTLKIGRIAQSRRPHLTNDVLTDEQISDPEWAQREGMVAFAGYPLVVEDRLIGVMAMFGRKSVTEFTLKALSSAADGIALGIERIRVMEALRESRERFRQMAENIREVFWLTDLEKNQMLYISPGYEEIWGRTCQGLYASPRSWLDAIHPDDRDRILAAALTKQVAGQYDEEYRIVRPDGSVRWIRDRAFPVRDQSGKVYRIAGIAEDITEGRMRPNQSSTASPNPPTGCASS